MKSPQYMKRDGEGGGGANVTFQLVTSSNPSGPWYLVRNFPLDSPIQLASASSRGDLFFCVRLGSLQIALLKVDNQPPAHTTERDGAIIFHSQ